MALKFTTSLVNHYYRLTSWIPRRLPETEDDIARVKEIFTQSLGLEDKPQVWYTIFANMASVKNTSRRVSYASLATIAKRLEINKLLQDQKTIEHQTHMDKLAKDAQAKVKAEGSGPDHGEDLSLSVQSQHTERDVSIVPNAQEQVVQPS